MLKEYISVGISKIIITLLILITLYSLSFSLYFLNSFICLDNKIFTYYLSLLISIFLFFVSVVIRKYFILLFILINYSFQNIYIGVLSNFYLLSINKIKLLLMIKDLISIFIFIISALFLVDRFLLRIKKMFIPIYVIFCILLLYLFFYRGETMPALAYFRDFSFPFIFLLLGYIYINSVKDIRSFLYVFMFICFVIVNISLYELVIDNYMWETLNAKIINIARGFGDVGILKTVIMDNEVIRIGGTFLDSVNFAYFLSASIAIFLAYMFILGKYMKLFIYFLLIITFIILVFTFGKGGWLISILVFLSLFIKDSFFKKYNFTYLVIINITILISIPLLVKLFPTLIYHFYGLFNSIVNFKIIGNGIGSGGNFLKGFIGVSHEEWLLSSESGLGTMLYQMGLIFTFLYYGVIFLLLRKLSNFFESVPREYRNIIKIQTFLIYGWIIGSIFQENAFSPAANFLIFLFLGMNLKILEKLKYDM